MSSLLRNETGTIRKKWTGRIPVALLYPNSYPVAVSNLGLQLVYSLLNAMDEVVCERFVYPEPGHPLRSLESSRPLTDFPLVFASVSFEHDYPRLAALLAAGQIPPFAADRSGSIGPGQPLVVMGGVGVFMNPEPLALFADLMVIGEAEPVLHELMTVLADYASVTRDELLRRLGSELPGCYVPSLTRFTYDREGRVLTRTTVDGLPPRVQKVVAGEMDLASHSTLLSPEAELGMYMVEMGRGCSRGCRFCAAGYIYRPPRLWSTEAILRALARRPAQVDRIGLLGVEMASAATMAAIATTLQANGCALSFSSLRADRIGEQTLELLAASKLKSVAIAADGASARLRTLINKGLDEADLLTAAERLVGAGIFHLKMYVMIGLPTETQADLDELIALVERVQARILPIGRARGRVSSLTLSINCFVPKPWTPFQFCAFGGLDPEQAGVRDTQPALLALKEKIRYLRRMLQSKANLRLKFDHPEQALHQAVFSRADRRLGPVLLALGSGQGFKQACKRFGIEPWQFAIRPRGADEQMCWEVIDHGIHPGYLFAEYQRALQGRATLACEPAVCRRCGVCHAGP